MWGLEDDIKIFLWTDIGYLPSIMERKNTIFFPGKSNDLLEKGLSAIYNQNYDTKYKNLWIGASHGKFGRYITLEDYLTTIYEYNNVPGRHNSYKFRNDKILIELKIPFHEFKGMMYDLLYLVKVASKISPDKLGVMLDPGRFEDRQSWFIDGGRFGQEEPELELSGGLFRRALDFIIDANSFVYNKTNEAQEMLIFEGGRFGQSRSIDNDVDVIIETENYTEQQEPELIIDGNFKDIDSECITFTGGTFKQLKDDAIFLDGGTFTQDFYYTVEEMVDDQMKKVLDVNYPMWKMLQYGAYIFPYFKRNWIVKTYRLVDIKDSLGTRSLDDRVQEFIWNACNRGINERRD